MFTPCYQDTNPKLARIRNLIWLILRSNLFAACEFLILNRNSQREGEFVVRHSKVIFEEQSLHSGKNIWIYLVFNQKRSRYIWFVAQQIAIYLVLNPKIKKYKVLKGLKNWHYKYDFGLFTRGIQKIFSNT